jgi:hypothetical protein
MINIKIILKYFDYFEIEKYPTCNSKNCNTYIGTNLINIRRQEAWLKWYISCLASTRP